MERLTHERVNGIKTGYWSAATKEVLVQKLAAYENTGYEPDEIRAAIEQAAKNSETKTATIMAECIATIFPDDGSTPIVCISAEAPISAAPELLAHELAHVATPEDTEHGESWSAASEAIFKKYNELLGTMIPDEPEPILSPHQPGDGGILTMPLRDNVPEPPTDDWQLTTCPVCGAECWQTDTARRILALEPDVRTACTACALKGLGK